MQVPAVVLQTVQLLSLLLSIVLFFFNDTATTEIYTLSLHDALPICFGDASGLRAIDTPCGRIGTLICWESYMPHARSALYAQGIDLYIAPTYDSGERWIATMQHVAREGGCWVIGAGCALRAQDIPDTLPG